MDRPQKKWLLCFDFDGTFIDPEKSHEIDKKYSSKIAEREVFLKSKIAEAMSNGEFEEAQQLEEELSREIRSLKSSLESEKENIRNSE